MQSHNGMTYVDYCRYMKQWRLTHLLVHSTLTIRTSSPLPVRRLAAHIKTHSRTGAGTLHNFIFNVQNQIVVKLDVKKNIMVAKVAQKRNE